MSIVFPSKSPEYGWLSNFSEHGFTLHGVRWPSVEHFYQAQKYAGTEAENRIRKADTPLKARKSGQDRSLVVRSNWDADKEAVMRQAVAAKISQNWRLGEMLAATGDLIHCRGPSTGCPMTALRDAVEKETDRTVMDHIVDGLRQRQSDLTELYSLALRGRNIAVQLAAVRGLGRACKLCYPTYGYQHMAAYLLGEIARKVLDCDPQVREAAAFLLCESENEKS